MKVKITAPALRRLNKIDDYYKSKGISSVGRNLKKEIVKQSKRLSKNPQMGQEEAYLKDLNLGHRYLLINPNYKLIYLIVEPFIYVTDVFDVRRNPEKINP